MPARLPARGHAGVRRAAGAVRGAARARRQEHGGVPRHETRAEVAGRRQRTLALRPFTFEECAY